jgi:hypothetical protein
VNHTSASESGRREEGVLHVPKIGQEIGGAEDGASAGASDGAEAAILFHSCGLVRPSVHQWVREQAIYRKGIGSHLCVHIDVSGACGNSRDVLHRVLPDVREKVHGAAWGGSSPTREPSWSWPLSRWPHGIGRPSTKWTKKEEVEWHIFRTGGQHYNGQAERLIGLLKRCWESTLNNRRLTLGELKTVVAEATQLVNSRPLAKNTGDPETGGPITPLHLQLGRATVVVPRMKFEEAPRLTQRLQYIAEAKEQFWKKWMQHVFSGRMLNHKWVKTVRNVAVRDVVYLAEVENDDPTYRLGIVVEANPGEDGCVRTFRGQYTNPGKAGVERSPPKTTTQPIYKIAVIVRAGYVFEDDVSDNEVGPRGRKSDLGARRAVDTPGPGPAKAEEERPGEDGTQPTGRKRRRRPKRS